MDSKINTSHLLPLMFGQAQVEGGCSVPIICQQFGGPPTVFPPHDHHTLGRGPGGVGMPLLPQGVGPLPPATSKSDTRLHLRAAAFSTPTCDEAGLGMLISFCREVG